MIYIISGRVQRRLFRNGTFDLKHESSSDEHETKEGMVILKEAPLIGHELASQLNQHRLARQPAEVL